MFKKQAKDEPNPWLKIDHNCDWLEANEGKELVCGLCGKRQDVTKKEKKNVSKRSKR